MHVLPAHDAVLRFEHLKGHRDPPSWLRLRDGSSRGCATARRPRAPPADQRARTSGEACGGGRGAPPRSPRRPDGDDSDAGWMDEAPPVASPAADGADAMVAWLEGALRARRGGGDAAGSHAPLRPPRPRGGHANGAALRARQTAVSAAKHFASKQSFRETQDRIHEEETARTLGGRRFGWGDRRGAPPERADGETEKPTPFSTRLRPAAGTRAAPGGRGLPPTQEAPRRAFGAARPRDARGRAGGLRLGRCGPPRVLVPPAAPGCARSLSASGRRPRRHGTSLRG